MNIFVPKNQQREGHQAGLNKAGDTGSTAIPEYFICIFHFKIIFPLEDSYYISTSYLGF